MSRVLIVSPFVPPHRGGLETYIGWLTAALATAGHDVRWLTTDVRPAAAHYVVPARDVAVGGGTSWPLVIPSSRIRQIVDDATAWADLVLHQNCFWNLTSVAAASAKRNGTRQRTIVHAAFATYPGAGATTHLSADAYRIAFGKRQLLRAPPIAVSHASVKFMQDEYGVRAIRVPCPLPDVPEIVGATLAVDGPVRIAWVGRLAPVKAPNVAVAAIERLTTDRRVELHMFGGGPMELEVRTSPAVILRGDLPRVEVLRAVADCHIFLSTSLADNAQLALLEALVLERPSVATDVGEASAYLAGALRVGLTSPGDVAATARALDLVIADWPSRAAATAERGRSLRSEYDPEVIADQLLRVLGLTLAPPG